jgi:hypothetical protein
MMDDIYVLAVVNATLRYIMINGISPNWHYQPNGQKQTNKNVLVCTHLSVNSSRWRYKLSSKVTKYYNCNQYYNDRGWRWAPLLIVG